MRLCARIRDSDSYDRRKWIIWYRFNTLFVGTKGCTQAFKVIDVYLCKHTYVGTRVFAKIYSSNNELPFSSTSSCLSRRSLVQPDLVF